MKASDFCKREVVVIEKDASVFEAAQLMREMHVGSVVVVESEGDRRIPLGVLTDRDIVVEFVSQNLSTTDVAVGDAMSYELVTIDENATLFDVIERMSECAVRRMPVINAQGGLVGLVASDNALELLAEQLTDLAMLVALQQRREADRRT